MNSLKEKIAQIRQWCQEDPNLWELITGATRGPDSPSERASMLPDERDRAYAGRRARKAQTIEVLRGHIWGPLGPARTRTDRNYVILPPEQDRDHFDRHVARAVAAAKAAGIELEIRIEGGKKTLAPNQKVIPLGKPPEKKPPVAGKTFPSIEWYEKQIKTKGITLNQYLKCAKADGVDPYKAMLYQQAADEVNSQIAQLKHQMMKIAQKQLKQAGTAEGDYLVVNKPEWCPDCGEDPCICNDEDMEENL